MTETILTDDDVAALEALESGGSLTDDQVGRLQTLENTPFFADSIKQGESKGQRFTGAGFAADGSYVSADPASPMVQAQQDPVPPIQGPVRGEDGPAAQQPPEDGMEFNLVTPPPMYVEERETNIRGPRLGAMGPAMESGDFYADDEELLDALRSAPAQGRVLTADEHRTMLELEEKESDKLGALKSGAGMMAAGLWEMAKGIAVEQGITVPGAIGQAISSAVFDPANAASILKQGMVTATNRAVQGELTKVEGMRKGYIGMRQIWSWFNGFIENDQIATDQRQAVVADLRQTGAFGADNVANAQLVEQETAKRREQGLAPFAPTDRTQEFETKYQRYLENEKLNRAYTGQNQYLMGEQVVNERPGIVADQLVTAFNPITGQSVEPLPYTSMGYGMMYQLDTYVGFGAGYISKARVASRAAAAARPLFSFAEKTATKAADVAKTGRDAHKLLTMSNIASGGALATGLGMQFNQSTGDFGKALMFFGAIKPTMRAAGFVFKKVPGGSNVMEAAGVFRPQALRIIAEESKAGPLGAGATAQTPATQAAAIRAARPEAAQRLVNRGSVPDRYARFMGTRTTRAGDVKLSAPGSRGFDSTLKRVAQNPENPPNVRRAARAADEIGLTQAFRATDDAISGALAGLVGSSPFAAIAPDDQTAGGILAVGTAFGAAGGIAGGVTSFKGDAVDADIARFMVDTEAYGGDPQALFQIPRRDLAAMAALQSMSVNKGVDFVALRTEDYWLNVPEAKGAQGYFAAGTAKDGSTPGRMRLFVDLGHSVVQGGGIAKVVKASDGMYELTVVRPDGKVMYPAPASDGSQPVIRRKSPNDFNVKDGDPVSPYSPLNRQPPRIVTSAHEFMHALMNSDMFGGDHQGALRGLIYDQYKPEAINSMAREYAQRLLDAQINNGAIPKPTNEEAKAKLIDDMMIELSDDSVAKTGDQRAWIADEILAETWQDVAQTTDINRMRQGKSADGRLTDAARSIMVATTRALETFGMKFDWATGKPLTNPSTIFRDNPLANNPLIRKRLLESVRNYDRYLTLLEDAGAVESKGSPLPRSGSASDWAADGTMRTHDIGGGIKENDVMIVDPDGQVRWKPQDQINREYSGRQTGVKDLLKRLGTRKVGQNDPTFGLRDAGPLRTIYSGAELPMENSVLGYPPVLASFPKWYREMYMDTILPAQRAGETVRFSNNTVGTRSDQGGPYKLKQLISSGFAKQSEGVPFGVQITKSGNHINIEMIDLNSFKAATLKAINDGKISYFNNDYKQVVAGLKQLMDNYRNKRDGSYMIGEEGKNILNGLLYGKSRANQGYGAMLNPRGSIRTYRMDRMNWMERTGDNGYFFDNDRAKNNRMPEAEPVDGPNNNRMPSALPQAGMAMPEVPRRAKMRAAAILNVETGKIYTGPSHPQIYDSLPRDAFAGVPDDADASFFMGDGWNSPEGLVDGFVDAEGKFYDREDAARAAGSQEPLESVTGLQARGDIEQAPRGQAMPEAPANLTTDQILRELEENQGYLGLSTLGMREGRPVKGGAQQTRELLKRNTALNEELRRRGEPQEESDVARVLRQRGQAMPDAELQRQGFSVKGYHGGRAGYGELNTPAFVASSPDFAKWYAGERGDGTVYDVRINPSKMLDLTKDPRGATLQWLKAMQKDGIKLKLSGDTRNDGTGAWSFESDLIRRNSPYDGGNALDMVYAPEVQQWLRKNGYDGVHAFDTLENTEAPVYALVNKDAARLVQGEATSRTRGQAMPDVADAPPFYLKSSQAIDAKVQGKAATPDQIKAILTNPQNGIKAEELKWTGVMQEVERLAKENSGKVPKEALLRYLAEDGAVRLEEVTLGQAARETRMRNQAREDLVNNGIANPTEAQITTQLEEFWPEYDDGGRDIGGTKYSQYQLPGGENYREVVLAMPNAALERAASNLRQFESQFGSRPIPAEMKPQHEALRQAVADAKRETAVYTSSHFDTPNYVAHMRLNERVDAKGKAGLFIEELQSDRHQQGREKGYNEDLDVARREELRKKTGTLTDAEMQELGELNSKALGRGIPDAPFRTSWPLQLFKRALRDAVADGKDWIGWTTGETQAARYDLSKQVSKVYWNEADGGTLTAEAIGGDQLPVQKGITREKLPDVIGKDAAQRMIALAPDEYGDRTLKGDDLKVGGEGMKGFYDNMVPKEVAKYVKQWGGQVEKSLIRTETTFDPSKTTAFRIVDRNGNDAGGNADRAMAQRQADQLSQGQPDRGPFTVKSSAQQVAAPVWRVSITPQMREGIKKAGQALFVGGAAAMVAEDQLEQ